MKNKFHGLLSIIIMAVILLLGLLTIVKTNLLMGALYLFLIIIMVLIVVYSYCGKCICRNNDCGHILPGKVSKILPQRKQSPYTVCDIISVIAAVSVLLLFPQYWLVKNTILLVIYWSLFLLAVFDITLFVCPKCKNKNCAMCKK